MNKLNVKQWNDLTFSEYSGLHQKWNSELKRFICDFSNVSNTHACIMNEAGVFEMMFALFYFFFICKLVVNVKCLM